MRNNKFLIRIGLVSIVVMLIPLIFDGREIISFKNDLGVYSDYAQYLSVVISLITIYFVFKTFTTQQDQLNEASRQRFESVFYGELIPRKDKLLYEKKFSGSDKDSANPEPYGAEMIIYNLIADNLNILYTAEKYRQKIIEYSMIDFSLGDMSCEDNGGKIVNAIYSKAKEYCNMDALFQGMLIDEIKKQGNLIFSDFIKYKKDSIIKIIAIERIKMKTELSIYTLANYFSFVKLLFRYIHHSTLSIDDKKNTIQPFLSDDELKSIFLFVTCTKDVEFKTLCDKLDIFKNTAINMTNDNWDDGNNIYLFLKDEYLKL